MEKLVNSIVNEIMIEEDVDSTSCSCGCGTCENKDTINKLTAPPALISEGIDYHFKQNIPFTQNIYRPGSENYFKLYNEVRLLCESGLLVLEGEDKFLIETTDIGLWGEIDGEKVPLDFPMEEEIKNDLPDKYTSKYDILYTKTRESINLNGKPIAKYELSWNGHDIEYGGVNFSNKAELERFADNYDLPINLYKKLRYKDPINEEEGVPHYTKDGKEWKGKLHKMPNGSLMSGNPHDKNGSGPNGESEKLYHKEDLSEAKKNTKKLNKPMRDSSGGKAYKVYVKDPKTKNIKTVRFGSGGLRAKINDKKARNAFAARHKCAQKKDKTKAGYWSCRLPRYAKLLGLKSTFGGFW
jgi:hypothetical protein